MDWPFVGREDLLSWVAAALEDEPGGAILQGEFGVGKTRLSQAIATAFVSRGWHVERCIGSVAGSNIPFSALSHLLPAIPATDVAFTIEMMRREILRRAGGSRLLLSVDDVNLLDTASMTLVHKLASFGDAAVIVTRRIGEPGNDDAIASLWKDSYARLFEVPPLDRESHDNLIRHSLPEAPATLFERLWQLTNGNPLFLRELIGMVNDGNLAAWLEGESTEAGEPGQRSRLADIVDMKARRLPEQARAALDVVALAEPIEADLLQRLSGRDSLGHLAGHGMVTVEGLGGREYIRTSHPIYSAAIRATLPVLRKRALWSALANGLLEIGLELPGDAMKAANWLLDAGDDLPPGLATKAAAEALAKGDAVLAERFARSRLERGADSEARIILGAALSAQHNREGAREVFEQTLAGAANDTERAAAALAYSRHRVWMELDIHGGETLLDQVSSGLSDNAAKLELRAEQAIFAAVAGDAVSAARIAAEVLADTAAGEPALLSALVQSTLARSMLGWFDGIEEELDRGDALATRLQASAPLPIEQLGITRAMWLRQVDFTAALGVTSSGYNKALRQGGATGLWSMTHAWVLLDSGDLDTALRMSNHALESLSRFDPFHNLPMAYALHATIAALRGESSAASDSLVSLPPSDKLEPRTRVWADRAQVWLRAPAATEAAALAIRAGRRAEERTMITWSASLYHDAVRLGDPDAALEPLTRLAQNTTAPVINAMARNAHAGSQRDPDALIDVAREFEALGSALLASEALSQAASFSGGAAQARLTMQALRLASLCPGAATPLIRSLISPISGRELEVATHAARGGTSQEIADRLFLSVRTVDNHLAAVYRKLGVSGREELMVFF